MLEQLVVQAPCITRTKIRAAPMFLTNLRAGNVDQIRLELFQQLSALHLWQIKSQGDVVVQGELRGEINSL